MKRFLTILAILSFFVCSMSPASIIRQTVNTNPPDEPVRLIFVHHSTGGNWLADPAQNELGGDLGRTLMENNYYVSATNYGWGPDSIGDATDIPNWLDWFRGERSAVYLEALYNEGGQNLGDFGAWPRLNSAPDGENTIIVFKSCFPNSDLEGSPNDAPTADGWLSVGHAKYIYNEILKYFATRPDKLFIVITAPPLSYSPNGDNARAFNEWLVNDWLTENDYQLNNVAVFDFYNVLTGADNHHRIVNGEVEHTYVQGQNLLYYPSGDDHPSRAGNSKTTEEFVPMLNAFYNAWAATVPDDAPVKEVTSEPAAEIPSEDASTGQATAVPGQESDFNEDFENGAEGWEAFHDEGGSSITCAASDGNAAAGDHALRVDFDVIQDGWSTCGVNFSAVQDWSAFEGLRFTAWLETDGAPIHVDLYTGSVDNRASYYALLDGVGGGWTTVQIPWASFHRVEWEENANQPLTNSDQIVGIAFGVPAEGEGTLWIDELGLLGSGESGTATEAVTSPTEAPAADEPTEAAPVKKKGLPICGGAAALPLAAVVVSWWGRQKNRNGNGSRRVE